MHAKFLFAAIAAGVATVGASADIIAPLQDNTMFAESGALSNGAGPNLFAGPNAAGNARRALLAFDLSSIPAGATITSASLTMFMAQSNAGATNITLHRMLADWGEGTSNSGANGGNGSAATANDATWTFRHFNTLSWTAPGGDFDPAISAITSVAGVGTYTWSSAAMIADVQLWLTTPASNSGWLVQGDEAVTGSVKRFASREATTISQRPALTVTYTVPTPGAIPALCAGLGFAARRRRRG